MADGCWQMAEGMPKECGMMIDDLGMMNDYIRENPPICVNPCPRTEMADGGRNAEGMRNDDLGSMIKKKSVQIRSSVKIRVPDQKWQMAGGMRNDD
jgi:hypothetical protein